MTVFILSFLVLVGVLVVLPYFLSNEWNRLENIALCLMLGLLMFSWVPFVVVKATTGMIPNYSEGYRDGVIVKASNRGIFWKTNEVLLALGSKDSVAFQEPIGFSVPDGGIWGLVEDVTGKSVRVRYKEWFLIPFKRGSSSREIVAIEIRE